MNPENLKFLNLNIKDYLGDLILFVTIGFASNYLFQRLYFDYFHIWGTNWYYDFFPLSFEVLKFFFWIFLFLIVRWIWYDYIKTWIAQWKPEGYEFNYDTNKLTPERFIKEWILQGNSQPYKGGLLVTNSNSGCLIKPKKTLGIFHTKKIWKNFIINIEFEFPVQRKNINHEYFTNYLGLIFRAQNLDDYFMFEIVKIQDCLVFRPHVRVGGNWDAPILNIDSNTLPSINSTIKLNIDIKDDILTVSQGADSISWILPSNIDRNLRQNENDKSSMSKTTITEIYFKNRAGMVGFRCYGNQIAFIKSLEILLHP